MREEVYGVGGVRAMPAEAVASGEVPIPTCIEGQIGQGYS